MPWTSLAERIDTLPLILAGPIVRRTEPRMVTVWLALKEPRTVTLCIYTRDQEEQLVEQFSGDHATIRLGDHVHVVAVTAYAADEQQALEWGKRYYYDLFFTGQKQETQAEEHLATPGILSTQQDNPLQQIIYPGHPLPSFLLPAAEVERLRIVHGSCRKPHGTGTEALSALDTILAREDTEASERPQQLYLTGDQIYADDVAAPLLLMLIDAERLLFTGNEVEILPTINMPGDKLGPMARKEAIINKARMTTSKPYNHLLTLAEYVSMYLFAWSDVLWPDELPEIDLQWHMYPSTRSGKNGSDKDRHAYDELRERLQRFRERLPQVRRALANIATYMICDDHDITDDWFLDGAWCQNVLASPLGRRIIRNGLISYALFQAWGNTPQQFATDHGQDFLRTIDHWHGKEDANEADVLASMVGLPDPFGGIGVLKRSTQSLYWHYTYEGPHYQSIVMDTRTQRHYRRPSDFPGLLSPQAIHTQIEQARRDAADVTLIISATPVMGIDFVESVQFWSRWQMKDNYAFDREAWALDWGTFQQFLRATSNMKRVVFLSGDVHYAFGSCMEYWDLRTKKTAKFVNYTASPFCNEGSGSQISVLAIGYPRLRQLLKRGHEKALDFFIWDIVGEDHHTLNYLLTIVRKKFYRFWWAIPRMIDLRRSAQEIVLPAWGWLGGTFDALPPDRSYRLRYLQNTLQRNTKREHRPHQHLSRIILKPLRGALGLVSILQNLVKRFRGKLERTSIESEHTPHLIYDSKNILMEEAIEEVGELERKLEKPRQSLLNTVLHYEQWLSRWKAGSSIVGYNNFGEISFEWTGEEQIVKQRLWWYNADEPEKLVSTEYREMLNLPQPQEEPPLP